MTPSSDKRAGRPKKAVSEAVLTERIEFRVSREMREWIADNGYGAYLRQLVRRDVEAALSVLGEDNATEEEIAKIQRILDAEKRG